MTKKVVKVCTGGACSQNLSSYLLDRANNDIEFFKMQDKIDLKECPCQNNCKYGPTVVTEDEDGKNKQVLSKVTPIEMSQILKRLKNNQNPAQKRKPPRK